MTLTAAQMAEEVGHQAHAAQLVRPSCSPFSRFFTFLEVSVMRMRWTCATSSSCPGFPPALRADIYRHEHKYQRSVDLIVLVPSIFIDPEKIYGQRERERECHQGAANIPLQSCSVVR